MSCRFSARGLRAASGPVALSVGPAPCQLTRRGCAPAWSPCLGRTGRRGAHRRHGQRGLGRRPVLVGGEQGRSARHGGRGGISLRRHDTGGVAGLDGDGGVLEWSATTVEGTYNTGEVRGKTN
jgi:hypothetical protein